MCEKANVPERHTCLRARIFRRIMDHLEKHPSGLLIRLQAQVLTCVTARVFSRRGKMVCHRPAREALELYMDCTIQWMNELAVQEKACIVRTGRRLYRLARHLGSSIRRITGFTQEEDLQRLVFLLYRNIAIEMQGNIPGQILVRACFFSCRYTPAQCRMMSNMDDGVVTGIVGGGKLTFSQRLTEGCGTCRACFKAGRE